MKDLELAKKELVNNPYTCVMVNNEHVVMTSLEKGVKPLVRFYEENKEHKFEGLVLADKVVGRASALLAVLCRVKAIYTKIISEEAQKALAFFGIPVEYEKAVPYIVNRSGDGRCPMEELSMGIDDPYEVYKRIKEWQG